MSDKPTKSRASLAKQNCFRESLDLNFAQYKYHFPFPTHEPKNASLKKKVCQLVARLRK